MGPGNPVTAEDVALLHQYAAEDQMEFFGYLVRGGLFARREPKGQHYWIANAIYERLQRHEREVLDNPGLAYKWQSFLLAREPDTVLRPDVAYSADVERPVGEGRPPLLLEQTPSLAIEVLHPRLRKRELTRIPAWYLEAGVLQVWLIDPPTGTLTVYASDAEAMVYHKADTLRGGDLLPGFAARVGDLFDTRAGSRAQDTARAKD